MVLVEEWGIDFRQSYTGGRDHLPLRIACRPSCAIMARMTFWHVCPSWILVSALVSTSCGSLWTPFRGRNPACDENASSGSGIKMPPTVLFRGDCDDNSTDPAKWTASGTVAPTATTNLTMTVTPDSRGWFTGQQHQMDNLEITQEN